ncbi:hypothetical protein RV12_GL002839 [Enterococcus quebecensis]|nr:hypothetical protein RV12_GL002839 [Enterococcus quebecensis]
MGLIAMMLLTVTGINVSVSVFRGLLLLIFVAEIGGLIYLLRFLRETSFEAYYQTIPDKLIQAFPTMEEQQIQEDNQAYYFLDSQGELVKLNKKNIRNFPSKIRQYTLLVGFNFETDKVRFEQPLHFYYYDITQITHSENYKKEVLKNTNFIAKRKKRRIKTIILSLIGLALVGTILYFSWQTYVKEHRWALVEKQAREVLEEEINEQKTMIKHVTISRGEETIEIDLPKDFQTKEGYHVKVDDEKGRSYQSFISDAFSFEVSMIEISAYSDFAAYLKTATQIRDDSSVDKKEETLHPDFFKHEYSEQTKVNKGNGSENSHRIVYVYYFESEGNYGTVALRVNNKQNDQLIAPDKAASFILKSLKFDREESII